MEPSRRYPNRKPNDGQWRRRLIGTPKYLDRPRPGFFRIRLKKGAVWVPASIYAACPMVLGGPGEIVIDPNGCADCNAGWGLPHFAECWKSGVEWPELWGAPSPHRYLSGEHLWPLLAEVNGEPNDPLYVWEWGYQIGPVEYHRRVLLRERAVTFAPHEPEANPRQAIDLRAQPSLF